jgi:glutathione S-transferase
MEATWSGRTDLQRGQAWIDRQMVRVDAALHTMSRNLGETPYCTGIHLSLADIAVGCALGYLDFRFPDVSWRGQYANLARLSDRLRARTSFIDTHPTV